MNNMKGKNTGGKGSKNPKIIPVWWIYVVIGGLLLSFQFLNMYNGPTKISSDECYEFIKRGEIKKVIIVKEGDYAYCEAYVTEESKGLPEHQKLRKGGYYQFDIHDASDAKNEMQSIADSSSSRGDNFTIISRNKQPSMWDNLFSYIIFFGLIIAVWMFMMRRMGGGGGPGGQIFNIGKSKAKLFEKDTKVDVSFKDVAGLAEAKEEIVEIVDFLKNPKKYTVLGAKIPKGALLVGPPGTGKTLLARAVAGEAQVPFFSLSGSDFVEMFVGVGASRVRDLFKQAKEKSPCIIFIDEIDAIGRARGKNPAQQANDERENTLNQMLTEMDGFGSNSGIIVMAATNRADILDSALLRPGRFDRQIMVDMPDLNERQEIFEVHLKPLKLDDSVEVDFLARQTPGFSGADIANICNEAALIAARQDKKHVGKDDFLAAVDRVIGGLEKKNKIIKPKEKKTIAFHEAGHATVSWMMEYASPLIKVTIVPRGKSLGAAWYLPEERQITTKEQMFHEMCATLGGRAAEEIIFGEISTGALSDLEKVTKQAQAIVTIYGLNDKLGNISYYDSTGQSEYSFGKPYSEHTAQVIDQEISKIVEKAYSKAKEILSENKEKLTRLAEELLEKEVIFKEDLEVIFGKRQSSEVEENEPKVAEDKEDEEVVTKTDTDSKEQPEDKEEAPIEEQNKDDNPTT
ncbi:MAG: peptidase M41 [Flavobacteriales bacterium]|nr:peptidase M41 [Flavobacteriales bacterium]